MNKLTTIRVILIREKKKEKLRENNNNFASSFANKFWK
jgi:hypothetical protein